MSVTLLVIINVTAFVAGMAFGARLGWQVRGAKAEADAEVLAALHRHQDLLRDNP